MIANDPLSPPTPKPLWLMTLADLALLLIGFMVLIHATGDRAALARGLRDGFGANEATAPPPMPVDATAASFAPGSATLADPAPLVAWANAALRDPRVTVTVTGAATPNEGVLLASDRARAVAAALVDAGVSADRLTLATTLATASGTARATLTLAFVGDRKDKP